MYDYSVTVYKGDTSISRSAKGNSVDVMIWCADASTESANVGAPDADNC